MTDEECIGRILAGDSQPFSVLIDRYQLQVLRMAASFLPDPEEARDLCQEVFIEVFESLPGFRREAKFSTWLYRITVNKAINQQKKLRRKESWIRFFGFPGREKGTVLETEKTLEAGPDELFESGEMSLLINKMIDELPQNQRIAFSLHKLEELSHQQISEITGLTIPAIESLIHRAKTRLRAQLIPVLKSIPK